MISDFKQPHHSIQDDLREVYLYSRYFADLGFSSSAFSVTRDGGLGEP